MPDESTAVTSRENVAARHEEQANSVGDPCATCGLRNPSARRSCIACGAPLGGTDEIEGLLPVDLPLFERERECERIDAAVRSLIERREGNFVLVSAPSGLGRTRLLRHAAERLLASGHVRVVTTTLRGTDGEYAPFTRLLWERFGVHPTMSAHSAQTEVMNEVQRVLAGRSPTPLEHAHRVLVAAGLPVESATLWEVDGPRAIARMADSIARFFHADAARQPMAILVDNLDAASDEGLSLLLSTVTQLTQLRASVLVVAAGLPEITERLGRAPHTRVSPGPLSPTAIAELTRHLLPGVVELPQVLLDAVVRRASGSPGRLREILLGLLDARVIVPDEVPWRVDLSAVEADGGPISSADVALHRVALLDAETRTVLARAAIAGDVFWEGMLVTMARVERNDASAPDDVAQTSTVEALRKLCAAEILVPVDPSDLPSEREYAFALAGLRDALRGAHGAEQRRKRHELCARWLELAVGTRVGGMDRAIATHLENADLDEAAARAYLRAARSARATHRGRQAVHLFDRALELLPRHDAAGRVDALHDKGVVLSLLGRVDDASESFEEMLTLAHRFGARNKMAAALSRLGRIARGRGQYENAHQLLSRALELFRQVDDVRGVAAAGDDLGIVAYLTGQFDVAIEHSERALELRRRLEDPLGEALSTHNLGLVHFARGQPRQARACAERALALREEHRDEEGSMATRNVLAALAFERGDVEYADRIWRENLELAQRLGDRRMLLYATCNLGELALVRRDTALATQTLAVAEEIAVELDDQRALAEIERSRGRLACDAADYDRARGHLERSLSIARTLGLREAEALALRAMAEAQAVTVFDATETAGSVAERWFEDAIAILESLGAVRELARTRAAFGRHRIETGRALEGRRLLTLAVPVMERLELHEASEARSVLQSVGGEMVLPAD